MDDIRKALSSLDSIEAPDLWREIERRASVPESASQRGTGRFHYVFSATKFVVAGAIVALFGGFLLAGVLTQPSDEPPPAVGASASGKAEPTEAATSEPQPTAEAVADSKTATLDLLPGVGLVTEEVEPGVYRVMSDGHRELAYSTEGFQTYAPLGAEIVTGLDGSVWIFDPDEDGYLASFYRLGEEVTNSLADGSTYLGGGYTGGPSSVEVGPDGVVWALLVEEGGQGELRSFDGRSWTTHEVPELYQVEVEADGTVWGAADFGQDEARIFMLGSDGWQQVRQKGTFHPDRQPLVATPDGTTMYISTEGGIRTRDETGDWTLLTRFADISGSETSVNGPYVGSPDAFWVLSRVKDLVRFDGTSWESFDRQEHLRGSQTIVGAAPDGSVWIGDIYDQGCTNGVVRFDGQTWSQFLDGQCLLSIAFAPNGVVWLQAGAPGLTQTYAITPETATVTGVGPVRDD